MSKSNEEAGVFEPCNKSKEEILEAIRECAARTGYYPSFNELSRMMDISMRRIRQLFGRYSRAVQAAGVDPQGPGRELKMDQLFADWALVVRKLGKVPTMDLYRRNSRYSVRPLVSRFKSWGEVAQRMHEYAEKNGLQSEWEDVLAIARTYMDKHKAVAGTYAEATGLTFVPQARTAGPLFGNPLMAEAMATAPVNEMGVVCLFGMLAKRLGFLVLRIQSGYPDGLALRRVGADKWEMVRIEFEFESRNFVLHDHDKKECDLIVCWLDNWPNCPIEVVQLSKVVG